ncbi:hypothetical protein TWF481_012107 [Arthrobotrys musiformis]|uniref:F-box domain-containing protein n=1 Tax=Arthrobotrys musiformis TaxID=47236 RepID=A0AAV9VW78_9PEZI
MALPVPFEILLDIVDGLDRQSLRNLRLVNRQLCKVATGILFRDINIHYGLSRSMTQMVALNFVRPLVGSNLRAPLCVKSVFLPSESFFPRAQYLQFSSNIRFDWCHELPRDHPMIKYQRRNYIDEERAITAGDVKDDFDPDDPEVAQRLALYERTLTQFLESCHNLQEICIAIGSGWKVERTIYWLFFVANNVLPGIRSKLRKLKVLIPKVWGAYIPLFTSYLRNAEEGGEDGEGGEGGEEEGEEGGDYWEFPSLESLEITFNYVENAGVPGPADKDKTARGQLARFLSRAPKLQSFGITFARMLPRPIPPILPSLSESTNLTSLSLCTIFLPGLYGASSTHEDFKTMITSRPSLTNLEMGAIVLDCSTHIAAFHNEPGSKITAAVRDTPPPGNWAAIFALIRKSLPKLTGYKFGYLMYGRYSGSAMVGGARRVLLVIPDDEKYKMVTPEHVEKEMWVGELISPYRGDHLELEALKKEVDRRRRDARLGSGNTAGSSREGSRSYQIKEEEEAGDSTPAMGQQRELMWLFS